jgi:hypothetical protein
MRVKSRPTPLAARPDDPLAGKNHRMRVRSRPVDSAQPVLVAVAVAVAVAAGVG